MHDQRIQSPTEEDAQFEQAILGLLLTDSAAIWSFEEVVGEIGNRLHVTDAINRLAGTGLVHRLDGFVFPTRAAAKATELALR